MPWTCNGCGGQSPDDAVQCASCERYKTAWTIVRDRTRTLVLTTKRFTLLRGCDSTARAADDPRAAALTLVPATQAVAVDAARARDYLARGVLPPSAHVLFVALHAGNHPDLTVNVEVLFAGKPSAELSFSRQAQAGEASPVYVKLLCVHGAGAADVAFPDLHTVDVGEDDGGAAPTIEVAALGKRAEAVPVTTKALRVFAFSV